jgi:hypothetical protein
VSCTFSRETLALHVEGDLPETAAAAASDHLATCNDCRRFIEQLRARQSLLKSLRREAVSPSECTDMRREVMSIVNDRRKRSGWALRVERAVILGVQRRSYAMAALGFLGIVSVSVLAQVRYNRVDTTAPIATFEGKDALLRPEGYRDWIFVGRSAGLLGSGVDDLPSAGIRTSTHKVYINPPAYREYAKTGRFPEGTLMIWESVGEPEPADRPHDRSALVLASVKDSSRFDGGWGFFNFTGRDGTLTSKAQALSESSGCRACHRRDAETDHVFTQFYPVLQSPPASQSKWNDELDRVSSE